MGRFLARFIGVIGLVVALAGFSLTASAEDWKSGQALIDSVDSVSRTITINDEVYQVPTSCRIHRESGVRIPLSELRVAIRTGISLVPMKEIDYVRFEAVKKREGWEMVEITVLERAAK